jgi:cytochrome b subunit of formate dehydrogenase
MRVGTEIYWTKTGRFVVKKEDRLPEAKREQNGSENKVWFLGFVIMVLLVIGGVVN